MKHTPESLAAMSDFELNKAMAELLGYSNIRTFNSLVPSLIAITDIDCGDLEEVESCVDYCNNPSDVMPLVFEHSISLVYGGNKWIAVKGIENLIDGKDCSAPVAASSNPLRAAACCLILVLQENNQ